MNFYGVGQFVKHFHKHTFILLAVHNDISDKWFNIISTKLFISLCFILLCTMDFFQTIINNQVAS